MSGRIIIADATNLMKQLPGGEQLSKASAAAIVLEHLDKTYPEATQIHAVFDGHPFKPERPCKRIHTHFSYDQTADEIILKIAASYRSRSTVLTRDRELQTKARSLSAATPEVSMVSKRNQVKPTAKPENDTPWQEQLLKLRFDNEF
jgi:predicted RNA-binding protein with PIN domain